MKRVIIDDALNHVIGNRVRVNLLRNDILVPGAVEMPRQDKVGIANQGTVDLAHGGEAIGKLVFDMRQLLIGLLVQHIKIGF